MDTKWIVTAETRCGSVLLTDRLTVAGKTLQTALAEAEHTFAALGRAPEIVSIKKKGGR